MKIVCAWCGKGMGEREPPDDPTVTHGICEACKAVEMRDLGDHFRGIPIPTEGGESACGEDSTERR